MKTIQIQKSETPVRKMTTVIPDGYNGTPINRNLNIPRYGEQLVTTKSSGIAMSFHIEKISGFTQQ